MLNPNERPLTANDIITLQNEMKQTWPKRLANAAKRAMSHPEEHAHSAIRCFLTGLRKGFSLVQSITWWYWFQNLLKISFFTT